MLAAWADQIGAQRAVVWPLHVEAMRDFEAMRDKLAARPVVTGKDDGSTHASTVPHCRARRVAASNHSRGVAR